MGLGVNQKNRRIFLNLKEGKILRRNRNGQDETYDYVEGYLASITIQHREFSGEQVPFWHFELLEPNGGDIYSLGMPYQSGTAKSIINALASAEELKLIRIETYLKGDFTRAVVYNGGQRLSWKHPDLPPIEEVLVGSRRVKDDTKRMEFFESLADEIRGRIHDLPF